MATTGRLTRYAGWRRLGLATLSAAALVVFPGCTCGKRTLTIHRDEYINSEADIGRPVSERTGSPLELAVVVVKPSDLKNPANDRLRPGSGITSADWFLMRQTSTKTTGFSIPAAQIGVFSDSSDILGRPRGKALVGSKIDGTTAVKVEFEDETGIKDSNATLYVFGRFTDKDGRDLPVPPAVFTPLGKYPNDLTIRIGVDWNRSGLHQFIENTTAPR